jgi:hypothetical protein
MSGIYRAGRVGPELIDLDPAHLVTTRKKRGPQPNSEDSKTDAHLALDAVVLKLIEAGIPPFEDKITSDPNFEILRSKELEDLRNLNLDYDQLIIWATNWKAIATTIYLRKRAQSMIGASKGGRKNDPDYIAAVKKIKISIEMMEREGLKITLPSLIDFMYDNSSSLQSLVWGNAMRTQLREYREKKRLLATQLESS